jgi:hypothetical protein
VWNGLNWNRTVSKYITFCGYGEWFYTVRTTENYGWAVWTRVLRAQVQGLILGLQVGCTYMLSAFFFNFSIILEDNCKTRRDKFNEHFLNITQVRRANVKWRFPCRSVMLRVFGGVELQLCVFLTSVLGVSEMSASHSGHFNPGTK